MNTRFFGFLVAVLGLSLLSSCVEPPPGAESSIWRTPPRYGHGGTDSPPPERSNRRTPSDSSSGRSGQGDSRFGYSGEDDERPEDSGSDVAEAPRESDRDAVAEEKPAEEKEAEKKSGPPTVSEMPFAKGVPGKPLSVTLPPPHSHLGEVSIEQYEGGKGTGKPLPPGTPVEIPDPGNPGKKIYFKVP